MKLRRFGRELLAFSIFVFAGVFALRSQEELAGPSLQRNLDNQFLLEFGARPEQRAGLRPFSISTNIATVELLAADNGWVPSAEER